jgi:hypothetical protein
VLLHHKFWAIAGEPATAPGRLCPEPSTASRLVSALRVLVACPGAVPALIKAPTVRKRTVIQTGRWPLWFAPERFAGAPPGCRPVLNACSARIRRPVTQGPLRARAGLRPQILTRSVLAYGCAPLRLPVCPLHSALRPCVP